MRTGASCACAGNHAAATASAPATHAFIAMLILILPPLGELPVFLFADFPFAYGKLRTA